MKKFIDWLAGSFAPLMSRIFSKPWLAAVSSAMQRVLPFILTGSLIFFYGFIRSYLTVLPDLGVIATYSFGMLGLVTAFMMASQCMVKLGHSKYEINAGLIAICVLIMFTKPITMETGNFIDTGRLGPAGILVGMLAGLLVAIVFHLFSKMHLLENNVSLPDFVVDWVNNLIPMALVLGIASIFAYTLNIDVYGEITNFFQPLQIFGQTLPGLILICFVPAFLYSMGVSVWVLAAVTTPIVMAGIQGNIDAVAAGGAAMNIVTNETIYVTALIAMGGVGATLCLNVLMLFSKSKKLKVMGRICIGPSVVNINEPIMFGAPVVFNPLLMLPIWINAIVGPILVWTIMKLGWLNIPSMLLTAATQIPAPISSVIVTQDLRAVLWFVVMFAVYTIIWYPFFKVYEKQCLAEEIAEESEAVHEC